MKSITRCFLTIVLIVLFVSCRSKGVNEILSNGGTRKETINIIANDSNMSNEMIEAMMTGKISKTICIQNQDIMISMMQHNPAMMKNMIPGIMGKADSTLMSSIIDTMMKNPQMMNVKRIMLCMLKI